MKKIEITAGFAIFILSLLCVSGYFIPRAFASITDGTISSTNKYAWSESVGWIDFGTTQGNVHVTDSALTGYAWGENIGWISLNCSNNDTCESAVNYKVVNDGAGNLSGYGWSESTGWIDFNPAGGGVSVNSSGVFSGYAWGENIGWINFDVNNPVTTDWQPQSSRPQCNNGIDDDSDGKIDYPSDPDCSSLTDNKEASEGGGGLPAEAYAQPKTPTGGFKVWINDNAPTTGSRMVNLSLAARSDVKKMAISNSENFTDAGLEDFATTKQWDLCSRAGGLLKDASCPDGLHTVYVKFYTTWGQSSRVVSDGIILKAGSTVPENLQNAINQQIPGPNAPFKKYLYYKLTDSDVKRLQIFLNSDPETQLALTGVGSSGKETNYFGLLTKSAVIKFQEKYSQDILAPWGFIKGTGYVGKTTLAKINELIGK